MRFFHKYYCLLFSYVVCISCNSSNNNSEKELVSSSADQVARNEISALILADTLITDKSDSSERKFIRTADVKFKTRDVYSTTQEIENLTRKHNGFVIHTHLISSIINTSMIPVSADSLLERKEFIVENTMTIRVPNLKLDTLLYEINQYANFIDFRVVKAEDIHLQLLENTLKVNRASHAEKRYTKAIDGTSKKLNENMNAEEDLLALQNNADSHMLSNMAYMDKADFSTVSLNFYQPSTFKYERLMNHQHIKSFEPSLFKRLSEAFATGWNIFEEVLIFLARIWAVLLLGSIGLWIYKRFRIRTAGKF